MNGSPALPGRGIIGASWGGVGVFAVTASATAAGVDGAGYANVVVSLALFGVSLPLFLFALARAAVRVARATERITVTGLFFLSGSAPPAARRSLLGAFGASLVVTVISAVADEPFGVLVPMYPMALTGLWGALHGTFPEIPDPRG